MKKLLSSLILTFELLFPSYVFADQCSVAAPGFTLVPPDEIRMMNHTQLFDYLGKSLPTRIAERSGDNLIYSGPAQQGFISYGPYKSQRGSLVRVSPIFTISTNWRPGHYNSTRCTRRNFLGICTRTTVNHRTRPSGFTIDYMLRDPDNNNEQFVIYSQEFENRNRLVEEEISLPPLTCKHEIKDFEVRIHNAHGGTVDFTIHKLELEVRWRN